MVIAVRSDRQVRGTASWRRCAHTAGIACRSWGSTIDTLVRHAAYFTELAQRAAAGMHGPTSRRGSSGCCPTTTTCARRSSMPWPTGDIDLALRLVTSLTELAHLRIGFEAAGWAERVARASRTTSIRCFAAAVGLAARGAHGTAASSTRRVRWRRSRRATAAAWSRQRPRRLPGRRARRRRALRGRCRRRAGALRTARWRGLVATKTRFGWCGRCSMSRSARPRCVLRRTGLAAAEEAVRVADATANPTARSMARYALGLVLKKSEPDRALALFDEAAESAASVQNFWWHGIALMEAAATRAVHGDPARAARDFVDVLDHWDRVGDWSQQWLNLRYVTRFLVRTGATMTLLPPPHHCALKGRQAPHRSPLSTAARLGEQRRRRPNRR